MTQMFDVTVKLSGGLFSKDIPKTVEKQIVGEIIHKVDERMTRRGIFGSGGTGLGVRQNVVQTEARGLELKVHSTRRRPRTTGRKWQDKNVRIVKSMAGRVAKKAATRIAEEMGA